MRERLDGLREGQLRFSLVGVELLEDHTPRQKNNGPTPSLLPHVYIDEVNLKRNTLRDGEPCEHPGCLHHLSHPCEGCGRVAGIKSKLFTILCLSDSFQAIAAGERTSIALPALDTYRICDVIVFQEFDVDYTGEMQTVVVTQVTFGSLIDLKDGITVSFKRFPQDGDLPWKVKS